MTKQIRKEAPKDATHFRQSNFGVTYFKVTDTCVMIYTESLDWIISASGRSELHRLHKPKWLEPLVIAIVALVSLFVILG